MPRATAPAKRPARRKATRTRTRPKAKAAKAAQDASYRNLAGFALWQALPVPPWAPADAVLTWWQANHRVQYVLTWAERCWRAPTLDALAAAYAATP